MEAASPDSRSLSDRLDARLLAAGGDPYAVLAGLLGAERRPDHVEVLSLHGKSLGGLRLVRILGTGGMGVTYEGVNADGARMAVKVLGRLDDAELARFERECQILKALDHPNVVRYRAHGLAPDGYAYLAMDLVDGTDFETVLTAVEEGAALDDVGEALLLGIEADGIHRAPAYRRRILRILATVADALDAVHAQGVVHRDVKPANIIVGPDLVPLLIDFGLGRDLFREVSWTKSGAVVGTVGWMAPEQLDGRLDKIGPRTDVFAVGLLLYRALTGKDLQRDLGDLVRLRRGFLRLTMRDRLHLDRDILGVLHGCLEPEPHRRYASAAQLALDLRALLRGERPRRRPPSAIAWLWRAKWGRAFTISLTLLVTAIAWLASAPRWSTVSIAGLEDDQNARLSTVDGMEIGTLPLVNWIVPLGSQHDLVYVSRRTPPVPIHVLAESEVLRLDVLHVVNSMLDELPSKARVYEGEDAALLDFATHVPGAELSVDGVDYAMEIRNRSALPDGRAGLTAVGSGCVGTRLLLAPGTRHVVLAEPDGTTWERDVALLPARIEPLVMGGRWLGGVRAKHRFSWASVFSTTPDEVQVRLDGPVGPFMDGPGQSRVEDGVLGLGFVYEQRNTGYAPWVAGRPCTVELEFRFPEPVRSGMAVLEAQCNEQTRNEFSSEWSVEGRPWAPLAVHRYHDAAAFDAYSIRGMGPFGLGQLVVDFSGLPEPGTRWLRVRARMVSAQDPVASSSVRFLLSYVNTAGRADCALEVVGDPSPEPRAVR